MEWILTLLPWFGSRVSSGRRRSISGAAGLLQKNNSPLALILQLSDREVIGCLKVLPGLAQEIRCLDPRCSVTPPRALNLFQFWHGQAYRYTK
jgi:hypothetical protein